jgi:hypothetical protein
MGSSLAGLGVAIWTLDRIFDTPKGTGPGPGAVIGFASVVVAVLGVWLSARGGRSVGFTVTASQMAVGR